MTKAQNKKPNKRKIIYLNKIGEKRFRWMIWGEKLVLNNPSLVDGGEETRILDDGS